MVNILIDGNYISICKAHFGLYIIAHIVFIFFQFYTFFTTIDFGLEKSEISDLVSLGSLNRIRGSLKSTSSVGFCLGVSMVLLSPEITFTVMGGGAGVGANPIASGLGGCCCC
jgi:hypothetical protein